MRKLLLLLLCLPLLTISCDKKKQSEKEYFSFYADGKQYNYLQKKEIGFLGESKTLFAGLSTGNLGYFIVAQNHKDPVIPGTIRFWLSGRDNLPWPDTITFGAGSDYVTIERFLNFNDNYKMRKPHSGRIIFTERTTKRLTGTFEFDVELYRIEGLANEIWTDTILHITKGKFSIIPTL